MPDGDRTLLDDDGDPRTIPVALSPDLVVWHSYREYRRYLEVLGRCDRLALERARARPPGV